MYPKVAKIASAVVFIGLCVAYANFSASQEVLPPVRVDPAPVQSPGDIPKGVEVQARGPIHEAFATPLSESKATPLVAKKPPAPIDEMPPDERPEGDVVWIGGYYAWDDDRGDYLWVSGCWRTKPVGKEWVPGYFREVGDNWQWVPGFWSAAAASPEQKAQPVSYYPVPPAPPNVAPPGDPPAADTFYLPGYWTWSDGRYVWRAGYWTRVRPGYVYVPSHYQWTPYGYVFVPGYWDLAVSRRGVLYAPVYVDTVVVGPRYVYAPYYAVRDTVVLDTLFVRVSFGAYYFGDYYGPRYAAFGFEPGVVYSRRYYDPVIVYARWEHRDDPRWFDARINLVIERNAGRAPLPPRLVIAGRENVMVGPTRTIVAARGMRSVPLSMAARAEIRRDTIARHETLARERAATERQIHDSAHTAPREGKFNVPSHPTVGARPGETVHPGLSKTEPGKGDLDKGKGLPKKTLDKKDKKDR
jgi:hypothetical protein